MSLATVVLVHGAMHSARSWDRVVAELQARGVPTRAVDMPGRGARIDWSTEVAGIPKALNEELDAVDGPVVLCGHSMGGYTITQWGDRPSVRHLVYVAAFMPSPGERLSDHTEAMALHGSLATAGVVVDPPVMRFPAAAARAAFYQDCTDEDFAWAMERVVSERFPPADDPDFNSGDACTSAAWQRIPSTYVLCTRDQAMPVPVQRGFAERASEVVEIDSGHSPFVHHVDAVADVLERAARSVS